MLGEFSLTYGDVTINDQNNRSKKLWSLLEYLITFRDKEISQNELIELLWPDEAGSDNPANALKTLLHRVRTLLSELNYLDSREMIIQRRGTYAWNNQLQFTVDVDEFERLCHAAEQTESSDEKLAFYLDAIQIYKGDFLPKSSLESWVVPINTYYHSMYLQIIHESIQLLKARNDWEPIVMLCNTAIAIDAYDESLYSNLIRALVKLGNYQAALQQYEYVTDLFFTKFGITPSDELTSLYKEVMRSNESLETDLSIIRSSLREDPDTQGAFFCDYQLFKEIYQLEARNAVRNGISFFLCLVTVTDENGRIPPLKSLNTTMDKLHQVISASLRRSDVFSRYSVAQYILMLPATSFEGGQVVTNRIVRRFHRDNPRSSAVLSFKLQPLEPLT